MTCGAHPTAPLLVAVAHPDDEAIGMAGVIHRARAAGRRVTVAVVTNGDGRQQIPMRLVRRRRRTRVASAAYGIRRNRESIAGMRVLGLDWSTDPERSNLLFLGYPQGALAIVGQSVEPWRDDVSGFHRTYATRRENGKDTGDGDLRYLLSGRHSALRRADLAADLDALLELTRPSDVYTHVSFDGHPDHREVYGQVAAALERANRSATVHGTLMHPEGSGSCMGVSADRWPNPSLTGDHAARFTPWLDVEPPPLPPCGGHVTDASWGPLGPPDELVEVPIEMREPSLERNLKWQAIACHRSQVELNAGYMMAFVKRREFFWTSRHGDP